MVGWVYQGLMPLKQLRSYHGGRCRTCVSWLSHTSTNTTLFAKPPTTFLTCLSRGEMQKYAVKKVCLNRVSNSQPPGHESDMLITEPPGRGSKNKRSDLRFNFSDKDPNISLKKYLCNSKT